MRKRIVIMAVAGATLVGGAAVASAQEVTDETPQGSEQGWGWRAHRLADIIGNVLGDLVGDGTITQNQADAIEGALTAKAEEMRDARQLLASFWEDDALTTDEIAQLPEPNVFTDPDGPFADALSDGILTKTELEELRADRRAHFIDLRDAVEGFLDDDVLTSDEIAQLPEPNPFVDPQGAVADALSDGQLTRTELEDLLPRRHHRGDRPATPTGA